MQYLDSAFSAHLWIWKLLTLAGLNTAFGHYVIFCAWVRSDIASFPLKSALNSIGYWLFLCMNN
jgi:hypothetical protein